MAEYIMEPHSYFIPELWVVLSTSENGEGIVARVIDGQILPLVVDSEDTLKVVRKVAELMAKDLGMRLIIVKYSNREIVEAYDFRN